MTDFEQLNGVFKAEEAVIAYFACGMRKAPAPPQSATV